MRDTIQNQGYEKEMNNTKIYTLNIQSSGRKAQLSDVKINGRKEWERMLRIEKEKMTKEKKGKERKGKDMRE